MSQLAGKDRINWGVDPSPDLAIEIDVTSFTDVNDYLPYKVPEVWLFKRNQLFIHQLEGKEYILKPISKYFPNINVLDIIHNTLQKARESNASIAIRELRQNLDKK